MDPATATLLAAGIGAAGSIGGGYLSGMNAGKETKTQKRQRKLLDKLIGSLDGNGPFSDLYNADEATFQKSFVQPAQSMFRNQIAPQIQQQYIAGGQQRGTGLDDQLLRAGVDLDSMLNQQYYNFQNDALNRKQTSINSALGVSSGAPYAPNSSQNLNSAVGGYLSSDSFRDSVNNIFKDNPPTVNQIPQRKGFEPTNRTQLPNFDPNLRG